MTRTRSEQQSCHNFWIGLRSVALFSAVTMLFRSYSCGTCGLLSSRAAGFPPGFLCSTELIWAFQGLLQRSMLPPQRASWWRSLGGLPHSFWGLPSQDSFMLYYLTLSFKRLVILKNILVTFPWDILLSLCCHLWQELFQTSWIWVYLIRVFLTSWIHTGDLSSKHYVTSVLYVLLHV